MTARNAVTFIFGLCEQTRQIKLNCSYLKLSSQLNLTGTDVLKCDSDVLVKKKTLITHTTPLSMIRTHYIPKTHLIAICITKFEKDLPSFPLFIYTKFSKIL